MSEKYQEALEEVKNQSLVYVTQNFQDHYDSFAEYLTSETECRSIAAYWLIVLIGTQNKVVEKLVEFVAFYVYDDTVDNTLSTWGEDYFDDAVEIVSGNNKICKYS